MWTEALEISEISMKLTVDTRRKSPVHQRLHLDTSKFQFNGAEWELEFDYHTSTSRDFRLFLRKCFSIGVNHNPFHASVRVERVGTERIKTVLSQVTPFTDEFRHRGSYYNIIWTKQKDEVLRALPEFRRYAVLELLVFLKVEGHRTPAGSNSQIECSVTEAAGQFSTTRSMSVQATLLPNTTPCLESLSEDLAQLMIGDSVHDVEFQCGDQSTKAHKLIVCRRSQVIASMLESDMVEARTGVVKIRDMEPHVFNHFLRYIYSGQLPELTVDLALSLYESGDQYAVLGLAKRCSEYLMEHLTIENACRVLAVADAHRGEDLRESVIGFMLDNEIPVSGADWQDFCDAHPKLATEVLNRFCLKLKQR